MELKKVRSLIAKHEGLRLLAYKDTVGKLTIGYGHNLDDVPISVEIAEQLLEIDVNDAVLSAQSFEWFRDLDGVRQGVVVNMVFNLGLPRFMGFKKTIKLIEKKKYTQAGTEMLDSKWAKQVGNRAMELSRMMKSGEWQ